MAGHADPEGQWHRRDHGAPVRRPVRDARQQRFDYFPRSVNEIWDELDSHSEALEVESRIALHYYYDAYFMLNKKNTRLAEELRQGLEKAIADGSFDRLFDQHHGDRLRKAQLDKRTVIELRNPLLTPGTPSDRPELGYQFRPGRTKAK